MEGVEMTEREMVGLCFLEGIEDARARMKMGHGDEGEGHGSMWREVIGGVSCDVSYTWFASMENIRDGRSLVVGECVVDIFLEDAFEMAEDFDEDDEDFGQPDAEADLPFEYVDGGAMGRFDHMRHFEQAFEAAKARLKNVALYMARHEAVELQAGVPGGRSGRKDGL